MKTSIVTSQDISRAQNAERIASLEAQNAELGMQLHQREFEFKQLSDVNDQLEAERNILRDQNAAQNAELIAAGDAMVEALKDGYLVLRDEDPDLINDWEKAKGRK